MNSTEYQINESYRSESRRSVPYWPVILFLFLPFSNLVAQNRIISGIIVQKGTEHPIAYATVSVEGSPSEGTLSDSLGFFKLQTSKESGYLVISVIGFNSAKAGFDRTKSENMVIYLEENSTKLNEIVITAKKKKYRNKNNPAVDFIRNVIANKDNNNAKKTETYSYKKYEKLTMSLSLRKDNEQEPWLLRKYPFLKDHADTTKQPGRILIPVYLTEKSFLQGKKSDGSSDLYPVGKKQTRVDQYLDEDGLDEFLDKIYGEPDIYENDISLGNKRFLSPIAETGPLFYEYYLRDTIKTDHPSMIKVIFKPRNKEDILLTGFMYVTLDGQYAVKNGVFSVNSNANINWVDNIAMEVGYNLLENSSKYYLSKSTMSLNLGIFKEGVEVYGQKTYVVTDFSTKALSYPPEKARSGSKDDFGSVERPVALADEDQGAIQNIENLKASSSFRKTMALGSFVLSGFTPTHPIETGPLSTFYSYNPIEGSRFKIGGRTSTNFSERTVLDGYAAYGTLDHKVKFGLGGVFSLSARSVYEFPVRTVTVKYSSDIHVPGQELIYTSNDNILLSFRRGENDKMWYNQKWVVDYLHETQRHFSFRIGFRRQMITPAGALHFASNDKGANYGNGILSADLFAELRWAPNETFFQGKRYRRPIINEYPVFLLRSEFGIRGFAGGQFNYNKTTLNISKRFFMSQLGYTDVSLESGMVLGKVPYPLLAIHRANQSYAYQQNSYNLMNFLEFVSDKYAGMNIQHSFNGFFFNKIPLVKALKWREIISLKVLLGDISQKNNPTLSQGLMKLPENSDGTVLSQSLTRRPYMEGSLGMSNIFKFLRVDVVRRFTYLDNNRVSPWGIRMKIIFDF